MAAKAKKLKSVQSRFLNEFVRVIIEEIAKMQLAKLKEIIEKQRMRALAPPAPFPPALVAPRPARPKVEEAMIPSIAARQPKLRRARAPPAIPPTRPAPAPAPRIPQAPQISGLAQINPLLTDPAVQSLECTGPGRPLLINKGGLIQPSPLALSSEDINTLMHEISERTRIPLTQGLFKAFLGNLIIIAVISDIIGTRFVIQKRYAGA